MKLIDLYKEWMETGIMPNTGLCPISMHTYWEKTFDDYFYNHMGQGKSIFWGAGVKIGHKDEKYTFTPLRQTIVLLICAMHDEL